MRMRQWEKAGWLFLVSVAVSMTLLWTTVLTLVDTWSHSRTYAHGFLILPAVLYVVWCHRTRLDDVIPLPDFRGLVFWVILACAWFIGETMKMIVVQQAAVIAMLPALVLTTFGGAVFHVLRFPLGVLAFALPVGASIEPSLQKLTAMLIVLGLSLGGIPYRLEGEFIAISSGTWEVARDCGGLRYLLPGIALGYVYAAVMYRTWKSRVKFLLLCAVVLVLANGLRAYGIILGDHLGIAEGTDHRMFSYSIYGLAVVLLGWLGLIWERDDGRQRLAEIRP